MLHLFVRNFIKKNKDFWVVQNEIVSTATMSLLYVCRLKLFWLLRWVCCMFAELNDENLETERKINTPIFLSELLRPFSYETFRSFKPLINDLFYWWPTLLSLRESVKMLEAFYDILLSFWFSYRKNLLHCELFGVEKIVKQNSYHTIGSWLYCLSCLRIVEHNNGFFEKIPFFPRF